MFVRRLRKNVRIRCTKVQDRLYLKSIVPVEQVFLLFVGTHPQNVLQQVGSVVLPRQHGLQNFHAAMASLKVKSLCKIRGFVLETDT